MSHRDELISKLLWNSGGMGFGVTGFGAAMAWAMATPQSKANDLKSVVAVSGLPDKYTDEELEKLVAFSERHTADYDTRFTQRMGANLICINKLGDSQWMRKRMTWEYGPMFSPTLDEALAVFDKELA